MSERRQRQPPRDYGALEEEENQYNEGGHTLQELEEK